MQPIPSTGGRGAHDAGGADASVFYWDVAGGGAPGHPRRSTTASVADALIHWKLTSHGLATVTIGIGRAPHAGQQRKASNRLHERSKAQQQAPGGKDSIRNQGSRNVILLLGYSSSAPRCGRCCCNKYYRFIEQDYQEGEAGGAHHHRHAQGSAKPAKDDTVDFGFLDGKRVDPNRHHVFLWTYESSHCMWSFSLALSLLYYMLCQCNLQFRSQEYWCVGKTMGGINKLTEPMKQIQDASTDPLEACANFNKIIERRNLKNWR